MNLRNVDSYNIGLDLGTGSVGWAVTDAAGDLLHFKGKPTWGSRIFPTAETAADARLKRGQRRRYVRRRWRLDLLKQLFDAEMMKVDPEFFARLRNSSLWPDDRPGDTTPLSLALLQRHRLQRSHLLQSIPHYLPSARLAYGDKGEGGSSPDIPGTP